MCSSMAEHSAVNRGVVSSSLTWGAKEKHLSMRTGAFLPGGDGNRIDFLSECAAGAKLWYTGSNLSTNGGSAACGTTERKSNAWRRSLRIAGRSCRPWATRTGSTSSWRCCAWAAAAACAWARSRSGRTCPDPRSPTTSAS